MADFNTSMIERAPWPSLGFARIGAALQLEPYLGVAKIQLWGPEAPALFEQAVGQPPPPAGGSCSTGDVLFAWLAPGEWLVIGPGAEVQSVLERADRAGGDLGLSIDLTHACGSFVLSGRDAREVLAALTPLDLSAAALPVGGATRAPLGETSMFIARLSDQDGGPRFRIILDQTMAAYAARMLDGTASGPGARS